MPFRPWRPAQHKKRRFGDRVFREGGALSLSDEWRTWVVENLALGTSVEDVLAHLCANGVPHTIAARAIELLRRSPLTAAANRLGQRLRRHELVARLERERCALASEPSTVESRDAPSPEEFLEHYYAAGVPLVIVDALKNWPKLAEWSPSHLRERCGDAEVEIMTRRNGPRAHGDDLEGHRTMTRLADFCDRVVASCATNDFYLVANNRVTNRPALGALFDDVAAPHEYLHGDRDVRWTSMWFGPPGTVTPLHHDTANVLFCQVFGKKRVLLFPPSELSLTHAMRDGVYSSIDPEHPDVDAFPEFVDARAKEVVLLPGQGLFIPVGWWHHIRALEVSINLAFTAFKWSNQFDWYYPGKIE
jgi:hypothetical protein